MFLNDLFNEAKRPVKQGSVNDYPAPKKLHKGVDKIYARVLQRQVDRENGEHVANVDEQVAVIVAAHPQLLSYGIFKRVGRSGKCHIKLLGGKLKDWAAGDMIAVEPDEVYATWDPYLSGKTAVHRAYNDAGQSTVREADTVRDRKTGQEYDPAEEFDKLQKDPDYIAQMTRMGREEGKGWPKRKDGQVDEAYALKKRVKIVGKPAPSAWIGKYGWIGEIRHGLHNKSPKMYTVDLDHGGGSIMLPSSALRLVKDAVVDEGIKSKIGAAAVAAAMAAGNAGAYMPASAYTQNHAKPMKPVTQQERDKNNWDMPWTAYNKKKALDKANAEVENELKKNYHKQPKNTP